MYALLGQMVRCAMLVNIMILGLAGNALSESPEPTVRIVARSFAIDAPSPTSDVVPVVSLVTMNETSTDPSKLAVLDRQRSI